MYHIGIFLPVVLGPFFIPFSVYANSPTTTTEQCGGSLTGLDGNISSPNYPNSYYNNADCKWNITVDDGYFIRIKFDPDFWLENQYDTLKILEHDWEGLVQVVATYTGTDDPTPFKSKSNNVAITFKSDGRLTGTGFQIYWKRVGFDECGGNILGTLMHPWKGNISSPNYPNDYEPLCLCNWTITVTNGYFIQLTFLQDFHLQKDHDYLEVYETTHHGGRVLRGNYTGQAAPRTYTSTTSSVQLLFTSDMNTNEEGFSLVWERVEETSCGQELVVAGQQPIDNEHRLSMDSHCLHTRPSHCHLTFKIWAAYSFEQGFQLCTKGQFHMFCRESLSAIITVSSRGKNMTFDCDTDGQKSFCGSGGADLNFTYSGNALCPSDMVETISNFVGVYRQYYNVTDDSYLSGKDFTNDDDDDDDSGSPNLNYLFILLVIIPSLIVLIVFCCCCRKVAKEAPGDVQNNPDIKGALMTDGSTQMVPMETGPSQSNPQTKDPSLIATA